MFNQGTFMCTTFRIIAHGYAGVCECAGEADDGLFRAIQAGVPGPFGSEFQTTFLLGGPR